jgi:hypothetical protein
VLGDRVGQCHNTLAIANLLLTYEPEFIRFGFQMFMAFATIIIAWQGIRMMFSNDGLGEQMFDFAKLLRRPTLGARAMLDADQAEERPVAVDRDVASVVADPHRLNVLPIDDT